MLADDRSLILLLDKFINTKLFKLLMSLTKEILLLSRPTLLIFLSLLKKVISSILFSESSKILSLFSSDNKLASYISFLLKFRLFKLVAYCIPSKLIIPQSDKSISFNVFKKSFVISLGFF